MHTRLVTAGGRSFAVIAAAVAALTVGAPRAWAQDSVDWNAYMKQVEAPPRDTIPLSVYQGWKQYELNCSRCHGEFAMGTSFAPVLLLSVRPNGAVPTQELFTQTVCSGRPAKGMPSWCALGLDFDTITKIYSYIKGRSDGSIGPGRPAVKSDT